MAYKQSTNSVSRWSKILLKYKPHSGEWAWIFHRVSGVALTGYLFLHIYALRGLTNGRQAFSEEMALFTTPFFKFLEWSLFAFVIFHAMNGLRIAIVDLANGASRHKAILRTVYAVGIAAMIFMGVLIFANPFGGEHSSMENTSSNSVEHVPSR
jgi:succinate dehydrogenase / fumarate reductase cytochrome b subunit